MAPNSSASPYRPHALPRGPSFRRGKESKDGREGMVYMLGLRIMKCELGDFQVYRDASIMAPPLLPLSCPGPDLIRTLGLGYLCRPTDNMLFAECRSGSVLNEQGRVNISENSNRQSSLSVTHQSLHICPARPVQCNIRIICRAVCSIMLP